MARLGHGIDVCLFMTHLDHVGSLKLKSNYIETNLNVICKC